MIQNHKPIDFSDNKYDLVKTMSLMFPIEIGIDFCFYDTRGRIYTKDFIYKYLELKKSNKNISFIYPSVIVSCFSDVTIEKLGSFLDNDSLRVIVQSFVDVIFDSSGQSHENINKLFSDTYEDFKSIDNKKDCEEYMEQLNYIIEDIFNDLNMVEVDIKESLVNPIQELAFYINSHYAFVNEMRDSLMEIFSGNIVEKRKSNMKIKKGLFGACYFFEEGLNYKEDK